MENSEKFNGPAGEIADVERASSQADLRIGHIAMVVPDLNKATDFLTALGAKFGPVKSFGKLKTTFRGKQVELNASYRVGRIGSLGLEVFQPLDNDSPYGEFLARTGGGIHHISFDDVDRLEWALEKMESAGAKVISSVSTNKGFLAHYLESDALPGVVMELKKRLE